MNPKDHRKDFNRRWKITSSDSYEEAFKKFKQRIINIIAPVIRVRSLEVRTEYFCQYCGIDSLLENHIGHPITNRLHDEKNEKEFYRLIEVICLTLQPELNLQGAVFYTEYNSIIQKVQDAVKMSDINVTVTSGRAGRIIFYPEGEKKLDEELVNKTLSFLNEKSNHHFEEALRLCQKSKRRQSAEELRRSLEEFLRHKLKNTKGLKENIKKLRENLKEAGSPPEIGNISHKIFEIFGCLDKYFNEHSKHKNRNIPEPENEFLIYQTGLLLRYINSLDLTQNQKNKI